MPYHCYIMFSKPQLKQHANGKSNYWNISFFSIRKSPWQSANVEGFAEAYLCFLVSASAKKKCRRNWILRNLKKVLFQELKKMYVFFQKRNVLLNKKRCFYFSRNFLTFMMQIIYCIIHRFLLSLFIFLLFSYTSF